MHRWRWSLLPPPPPVSRTSPTTERWTFRKRIKRGGFLKLRKSGERSDFLAGNPRNRLYWRSIKYFWPLVVLQCWSTTLEGFQPSSQFFPGSCTKISQIVVIFFRVEKQLRETLQFLGSSSDLDNFQISSWNSEAPRSSPEFPNSQKCKPQFLNYGVNILPESAARYFKLVTPFAHKRGVLQSTVVNTV